jgi:hypothetical protein
MTDTVWPTVKGLDGCSTVYLPCLPSLNVTVMVAGALLAVVTVELAPELDVARVWSMTATDSTAVTLPVCMLLGVEATLDEGVGDAQPANAAAPRVQITNALVAPDFMVFSFRGAQR